MVIYILWNFIWKNIPNWTMPEWRKTQIYCQNTSKMEETTIFSHLKKNTWFEFVLFFFSDPGWKAWVLLFSGRKPACFFQSPPSACFDSSSVAPLQQSPLKVIGSPPATRKVHPPHLEDHPMTCKWLVSPIDKPFRPCGMGITLFRGLTIHGY